MNFIPWMKEVLSRSSRGTPVASAPSAMSSAGSVLSGGAAPGTFAALMGGRLGRQPGGQPRGGGGFKGRALMSLHDGGKVPKDGAYELEKGETVLPAEKPFKLPKVDKPKKRDSEYRRIYLKRRKKA